LAHLQLPGWRRQTGVVSGAVKLLRIAPALGVPAASGGVPAKRRAFDPWENEGGFWGPRWGEHPMAPGWVPGFNNTQ
jgi:hypothetical protein